MFPTFTTPIRTVKPLLNEEEFAKTTALVKEFGTNPNLGPKLQSLLEEKAAQKDNWVFETYIVSVLIYWF